MTLTQVHGFRALHTATTTPITEMMSARDMALTPHNLSRDGMTAQCLDGRTFRWVGQTARWER